MALQCRLYLVNSSTVKGGNVTESKHKLITWRAVSDSFMAVVILVVVILYSGFGKPIWIDEFLHFSLGAMNFSEATTALNQSLGGGVNWGQTPTLFLLDHLLLENFGANLWVLRLPSIIAGFLLIMLAVYFLRMRGVGRLFQWLLIFAFASQGSLMFYVGEARPYMLMASTAVALLVFFSLGLEQRRTWIGVLVGIYAIVVGALAHPYWIFFLFLTVVFGVYLRGLRPNSLKSLRRATTEASPIWIGVGLLIFAVTAFVSWAKESSTFSTDPYEFIESPIGAVRTLGSTHFGLLGLPPEWAIENLPNWLNLFNIDRILIFVLVAACVFYLVRDKVQNVDLVPPLVLLGLGVFSTTVISLVSLVRSYWIVQRQWLGGIAFATIAIVWLIALLSKRIAKSRVSLGAAIAAVTAMAIVWNSYITVSGQIGVVQTHNEVFLEFRQDTRSEQELIKFAQETGAWEYVANVNAVRGGPVWRGLALYYGVS